ncbi:isoleucine--tRNA ligase [Pantoea sp. Aalb]|uniref:isoleucine--tRNA ligase n=1 Tax=Pantoea sp. Aalb TaxID=2576762 RepID=UPI00132B2626|nr:isoleucine--tRNA ligase [Pantoea sp. Aalb]MXP67160.1 isoleucine--tRNA ligase [Pantoea sp. Aalb]
MSDYKFTLNLPETKFPMRGNLSKHEPEILQRWYNDKLYNMIRTIKKGKQIFILHDGPPYANGNIHIGHSVNKILKDIIIKSKGMAGYDAPYIPGWDCHGLPIEHEVEKIIGKPGKTVSPTQFRAYCRRYAKEQVVNQKKDFIRLGVLGDWENSYLTMNFQIEANIIRALSKIIANGHLYQGIKPVYWCFNCCSALAEAEVEYYDKISPSIYVMFNAINANIIRTKFGVIKSKDPVSIVIWTTTPWTIPANRGISLHPDYEYQLIQIEGRSIILAKELVDSVMQRIGIKFWEIIGTCKGSMLELELFQHPFIDSIYSKVLIGKHVTLEFGTGAVHTAPVHGPDDYVIGQKYNLDTTNIISAVGTYLLGTYPILDGMHIFNSNDVIIELLKAKKALLHVEKLQHNYPHCWRHKTPIIFRATPQWFISMDNKGLRIQSLKEIRNIKWMPKWGQKRIESMIMDRPDWCISRQRYWGVPMALLLHKETGELHPDTPKLMEKIAYHVEQKGIEAWWDLNIKDLISQDKDQYIKSMDTLDVWFDSGSTHYTVVKSKKEFNGQISDMYLEGTDQYRGWFMSSLLISIAMNGKAPYHKVLTHGFTVDAHGYKMSKSMGNIVKPQEIMKNLGADILRLWVASTDYSSEIVISDKNFKCAIETYRRIRNTARFLLANLKDFNPTTDCIKPEEMVIVDRWAVGRGLITQQYILKAYEKYDFHEVINRLMQFCSIEMGSFYLDVIKDRQYTAKRDCLARRSCQTALWHIIEALVRWISPIMSFTADEIWSYLPGKREKYVFMDEWYKNLFGLSKYEYLNEDYWAELLKLRFEVNKVIEQARNEKLIGSSLEATVTLYIDQKFINKLKLLGDELRFALLTSEVIIADYTKFNKKMQQNDESKNLKIILNKAQGKKCPRCWHYTIDIGHNSKHIPICNRCYTNVVGNGETRKFI